MSCKGERVINLDCLVLVLEYRLNLVALDSDSWKTNNNNKKTSWTVFLSFFVCLFVCLTNSSLFDYLI